MKPIQQRKKKVPKVINMRSSVDTIIVVGIRADEELKPYQLRKKELSRIHGIPENDIFVDPGNGLELYKTPTGWATRPTSWRGVSE